MSEIYSDRIKITLFKTGESTYIFKYKFFQNLDQLREFMLKYVPDDAKIPFEIVNVYGEFNLLHNGRNRKGYELYLTELDILRIERDIKIDEILNGN